jgi:hypothetical protein
VSNIKQFKSGTKAEIDWPNTQGDDWVLRWRMTRLVDGAKVGIDFDTEGVDFYGEVRDRARALPDVDPLAVIEFKTDEGNGWVTAFIRRSDTLVAASELYYEIKWNRPTQGFDGGLVRTLFWGRVPVAPRVAVGPDYTPGE